MPRNSFVIAVVILVYAGISVLGLTLLKQAGEITSPRFVAGALAYGAGFLIWILVILRLTPLSVGFPIAAGALILGTQIAGYLIFDEPLTFVHCIAILLITIGIVLLSTEVVH